MNLQAVLGNEWTQFQFQNGKLGSNCKEQIKVNTAIKNRPCLRGTDRLFRSKVYSMLVQIEALWKGEAQLATGPTRASPQSCSEHPLPFTASLKLLSWYSLISTETTKLKLLLTSANPTPPEANALLVSCEPPLPPNWNKERKCLNG